MSDRQQDRVGHPAVDMLMESIRGGLMMTRRERVFFGTVGSLLLLIECALVFAPVWVYWTYGFEPGVITALVVIAMGVYFDG